MAELETVPGDFDPAKLDLKGQVVMVVGATGGIGSAVARCLAQCGAQLVLAAKQVVKLERLADEIEQMTGLVPVLYPVNLAGATLEDYEKLAEAIEAELGGVDTLIHLAAHFKGLAPLSEVSAESWMETMLVNLQAPYLINRALESVLRKSEKAQILLTLDNAERTSQAYWGPYGIFQGAQSRLAEIYALELENQGIVVSVIEPPQTETALAAKITLSRQGLVAPQNVAIAYAYAISQRLLGKPIRALTA